MILIVGVMVVTSLCAFAIVLHLQLFVVSIIVHCLYVYSCFLCCMLETVCGV